MSDTISINENKTPDNGKKGELKGFAKFLNFLKSYFSKPSNIIFIIFAILLTLTVVIPLVFLLYNTVLVHQGEARRLGVAVGSLTLNHWYSIFFQSKYNYAVTTFYKPLVNSVGMALVACLISLIIGGGIAWLITRSDFPAKKFISTVFVFHISCHHGQLLCSGKTSSKTMSTWLVLKHRWVCFNHLLV